MKIGSIVRDRPVLFLYGLMIVTLAALLPIPPLLQNQDYHQFADQHEVISGMSCPIFHFIWRSFPNRVRLILLSSQSQ